jgi:predicted RNase H-like nuclease (RuvC/YqgF family)
MQTPNTATRSTGQPRKPRGPAPSKQIETANKQVAAIQRRLERWELDHLRTHARALSDRIENLERELYRTQDEAEYWHCQCQSMVEQLRSDAIDVGLTQDGSLMLMPTEAAQAAA